MLTVLVDYLLDTTIATERPPRKGLAAGLLAAFYTLFILIVVSYFRILSTIRWNPGYVPRGSRWTSKKKTKTRGRSRRRQTRDSSRNGAKPDSQQPDPTQSQSDQDCEKVSSTFDASGLEEFYSRDVYVCQVDGRPRWCATCCQFKTDRVHHCREVGRCVRKLDHFCPWCLPYSYVSCKEIYC